MLILYLLPYTSTNLFSILMLIVCIALCVVSVLFSAFAHRKIRDDFSEKTIIQPLKLLFASMMTLNLAVALFAVTVGYQPVAITCAMFGFIQWLYIIPATIAYQKSKIGKHQFQNASGYRSTRGSAISCSTINTMMMLVALNLLTLEEQFSWLAILLIGVGLLYTGIEYLTVNILN